ncbi:hypothetical protein KCP77_23200 [Salmonella enterica subsp. enterica]|nr:hypothetical protein KCP77_23200 [Salmonella enterica subsp. enterica]
MRYDKPTSTRLSPHCCRCWKADHWQRRLLAPDYDLDDARPISTGSLTFSEKQWSMSGWTHSRCGSRAASATRYAGLVSVTEHLWLA